MFNYNSGYSLSDIAASGRNNDGMFGDGGWWIILLFLFAGWGGNGFGFGGNHAGAPGYATQADVRAAVDQQTLISKLDQQTYGLADSTYAINSAITNGFHGVDTALSTLGYNMQAGFNTAAHELATVAAKHRELLKEASLMLSYNMATQACDTREQLQTAHEILLTTIMLVFVQF